MPALPPLEFTLDGLSLKQVRAVLRHQQHLQEQRRAREAAAPDAAKSEAPGEFRTTPPRNR